MSRLLAQLAWWVSSRRPPRQLRQRFTLLEHFVSTAAWTVVGVLVYMLD